MVRNKKGQTGGLITALIFGVAALVIAIIIAFVIVATLNDAQLLGTDTSHSVTAPNESDYAGIVAYVNLTGYTLDAVNDSTRNYKITQIWASTDPRHVFAAGVSEYNYSIGLGNVSLTVRGILTNASDFNQSILSNVTLVYTYDLITDSKPIEAAAVDNLTINFTEGVGNVSSKIPTVLLVAAIVLILSILAILVGVWQRMNMGGGSTL